MTRSAQRRVAATLAVGGLLIAGVTVGGPASPAAGDSGHLVTWAVDLSGTDGDFSIVSTTDASLSFIGAPLDNFSPESMEICNGDAWAISGIPGIGFNLVRWNRDTGALGASIPLVVAPSAFFSGATSIVIDAAIEADTTVDCAAYLVATFTVDFGLGPSGTSRTLASLDLTTGVVTPIETGPDAIATDPTTGVIYGFVTPDSSLATYMYPLDLLAPPGHIFTMDGLFALLGGAESLLEADFDPTGRLWLGFTPAGTNDYHLVTFPPGSDFFTATPTDIGIVTNSVTDIPHRNGRGWGLAFDDGTTPATPPDPGPPSGAGLAATGSTLGGIPVVAALLLAGGALLVLRWGRRRPRSDG